MVAEAAMTRVRILLKPLSWTVFAKGVAATTLHLLTETANIVREDAADRLLVSFHPLSVQPRLPSAVHGQGLHSMWQRVKAVALLAVSYLDFSKTLRSM